MRLPVDENLSFRVADQLGEAGHDAVHVTAVGLGNADDEAVFQRARQDDRVVVTSDADFGAMLALQSATAPSVLLLRSSDHLTPSQQAELIVAALDTAGAELDTGAIASLTPERIRLRTLPISDA